MPAVVSGILAARGGWATTIDNGVIAVRTSDVIGAHPPLVGVYLSLTTIARSHTRLHYLGPLQFWALALPLRLGGPSGVGLVFGATAINALAAAGSVWMSQRLAGIRLAAIVSAGMGLLAWSLGGQVLHDPWSPHLALFPFFFFLMAASAVSAGDVRVLPLAAFAGSLVLQLHLTYVVPVALLTMWVAIGLVLALRSRDVNAERPVLKRSLLITAVVVFLCWLGPIIDQLFGSHNATNVAGAAAGGGYARVGMGVAWRDLVHTTSLPPVWLEPFTGIIKNDTSPGWFAIATSSLVLAALAAATVWAWLCRSRSHMALCTTAVIASIGAFITAGSAPVAYHSTEFLYPRRVWWTLGVLIWIALAHTAVTIAAERWPARWHRADSAAVAFGLVAIAIAMAAVAPRLGPAQDYGSGGFGAVRDLGHAAADALRGPGQWELRSIGEFAQSVVGPGVASELILRGRPVGVPDTNFPDLGKQHFIRPNRRVGGTVLVVSGPEAGKQMAGYSLVARWDPAAAREPFRSYHQTLLVVPIEPVAVYVSATPAAN